MNTLIIMTGIVLCCAIVATTILNLNNYNKYKQL